MSAIDVHTHAFPDKLAPRAIAALEAECPWKAVSGGTIKELLASMDAADVDISVVCPIATKADQVEGIFKWCRKIRTDRIEVFPSVHPDTPDAEKWLERFAQEEFSGIKLHPMYQNFAADEPRMDRIYATAATLGLVVTIHCGFDIAFPADDDRASPARMAAVLDRHSDLRMICTHIGGWRAWEQAQQHIVGRDCFLETSMSLLDLGQQRAAELIRAHGVEKVMFGSDWPWSSQARELGLVGQLGLDKREAQQVTFGNAARLLGI